VCDSGDCADIHTARPEDRREYEETRAACGYSINIAGSILGVGCFSLASALCLPPYWWFVIGFPPALFLLRNQKQGLAAAAILTVITPLYIYAKAEKAYWSPYQKITLTQVKRSPTQARWSGWDMCCM